LTVELLEERLAPAVVSWNVDANGLWNVAGNWSTGAVPGAADDVYLDRPAGKFTITHDAGDFAVHSIHASNDALVVAGGKLTIATTSELGDFSFSSLDLHGNLTTSGAVNWSAGRISASFDLQRDQDPVNTFTNTGTLTLAGPGDWTVAGRLVNAGTIVQNGGNLILHATYGVDFFNEPVLVNQVTGLYSFQGAAHDIFGDGDGRGTVQNYGSISVSGATARIRSCDEFDSFAGSRIEVADNSQMTIAAGTLFSATSLTVGQGGVLRAAVRLESGTWTAAGTGVIDFDSVSRFGSAPLIFDFPAGMVHCRGFMGFTLNVGTITVDGAASVSGLDNGGGSENRGTIVQRDAGSLSLGDFTNAAGGLYDIQNDLGIGDVQHPGFGTFVNLGTLRKSGGAGTSTISARVNNLGGTLEVQTGILSMTGGGTYTGGVFGAAAGAFLDLAPLAGITFLDFSSTFTGFGAGLVRLLGELRLGASGATFAFNGQWVSGPWILGDTGLTNRGTLAIAGANDKTFSGVFTNAGTFLHQTTGNLQVGYQDAYTHPGTLNNTRDGIYDFQADGNLTSLLLDSINNAGIIRKSAGGGVSGIGTGGYSAISLTSTGGTFDIRSGTLTVFVGGVFTGGGVFNASAGATLDLAGAFDHPTTMSGAFTGSGAGTVRFSGRSFIIGAAGTTFNFAPGLLEWAAFGASTISGADLMNLGSIRLAGAGIEQIANAFNNAGTILHAGSGNLGLESGATLTNQVGAVYDFQADPSVVDGGTFINRGTLRKSGGTGTSAMSLNVFRNEGGVIDVQHGILALNPSYSGSATGATFTVAKDAVVDLSSQGVQIYTGTYTGSGEGTVRLTLVGVPGYGFGLKVAGATFNFPAGMFQWLGGTLDAGTTGFNNTGWITLAGADPKSLDGALNNAGTIVHAGTGDLQLITANPILNNLAGSLYDLQGDVHFYGNGYFNNAGTLRKSAGTGSAGPAPFFDFVNTGGMIDVQTGTFLLRPFNNPARSDTGGTFNVAKGALLDLSEGDLTSTRVLQGSYSGSGEGFVKLGSGILAVGAGGATFNFPPGMFQWTGGFIDGRAAPLTNRGTMTLPGFSLPTVILGALNNAGTIIMVGEADLVLGHNDSYVGMGVLTNLVEGLFEFQGDYGLVSSINTNDQSFINQGTLRKASGPGAATISVNVFSNTGALAVNAGTLQIQSATIAQVSSGTLTAGTWQVSAGCSLDLATAPAIATNNAHVILDGTGSTFAKLDTLANNAGSLLLLGGRSFTTAGPFSNTGSLTVSPGSTLSVTGDYTQSAAGALNVQLGGTPASGLFGQLTSTGNAALAGALNVSLVNGFGATAGQIFPVMSFAGSSGAFDTITGLTFGKFALFTAQLNPTSLVLTSETTTADLAFDSFAPTFPTTATLGDSTAITYTVKNLSATPATGDWYDSVYLSRDGTLDPGDALLGRVHHVGDVAGLSSYTETLTAPLPALADGGYHVIVLADSRGLVPDPNRPNNTGVSSATIAVTVPVLTLGTPLTGTIANGQDLYYRLLLPPGQDVTITADFTVPQAAEFYLRYGDLPDRSNFDQSDTSGELQPRLMLSNPQGGSYYLLLHGREGAVGGTSFTLDAEASKFEIVRLNPLRGSNKGDATIDLLGSKFTPQTQVSLLSSGGTTHNATAVDFIDPNHLSATFNLQGLNIGIYQVQAKDAGQTATSADTFLVTDIAAGQLHFDLSSPSQVRVGSNISVTLKVDNPSDSNVRVPFLLLDGTNVTTDAAKQEFFGGPNLPKILPPHYRGGVTIPLYTPDPKADGVKSDFNLNIINPTEVTINWDAQKASLRPKSIPADAWDAIWANFRPQLGNTLEDFYALLSGDFRALGRSTGLAVRNVPRLFDFEMRMANDLPALPVPAGGLDLAFPAPGLPLAFGRSFGASIAGRYYVGRLGRGWVDNLDTSASADADTGLVTIRQGGSLRLFGLKPDGSYSGIPGDFATLTLEGGAFRLREASGEVVAFRTDGQLDYLQDTNNNRLTAGYTGSQLTSLTHSNGSALTFHYNAQGRIDQVTDPAGRVASYAYDASGEHLLSVTTTAGTTAYGYTPEANGPHAHAITSISYPDGTHLFFDYDNRGRLVSQQQDGGANAISFTYDIANYRVRDALGNSTFVFYDDVGRTALRVDGVGPKVGDAGPVTSMGYDDVTNRLAQIQPPDGPPVTFGYDGRGNQTQVTDPQGQTQNFSYEPSLNRLISWKDALGHQTTYDHDPNGNPSTTTYADGTGEQFSYDAQGNVVGAVNRLGQPVSETYDRNGLLKRKDLADGTHLDYAYDAHGNMISATGPAGATTMEYDLADRMTKITYPGGRFLEYTYDASGRRVRTVDQSGFTTNYRYDAVGRLAELTDGLGQRIIAYEYDAADRLARASRGNGTFTTYEYDRLGQILHLVNSAADGTVLSRFDYTYDLLGRRDSMTTLEGTTTYGYDAASRLTSVTLPAGRTITYVYDAAGNRQLMTDSGVATAYTTNALNQYVAVGGAGLTYDAGGNLTAAGGSNSYSYDDQGQLLSATTPQGTWTYEYDALGNRIASTHNGIRTEYLIDPAGLGDVVGEYDGSGNLEAHYVHGLGLASRVDATNQSDYYEFDALGNTTQLTGPDGTVLNSYSYLPFGESLRASESVANPFTFVGELGVMREGNGLDFMRNRWYDPAQGRFTRPDPIGLAGGTNLYEYVHGDPVNHIDPSGLADLGTPRVFVPSPASVTGDLPFANTYPGTYEAAVAGRATGFAPGFEASYVSAVGGGASFSPAAPSASLAAETQLAELAESGASPATIQAAREALGLGKAESAVAATATTATATTAEAAAGAGKGAGFAAVTAVVEGAAAVIIASIAIAEEIEVFQRGELPPGVIDVRKYLDNDALLAAFGHFAYSGAANPVGAFLEIKKIVKFFTSTTQINPSKDPNDIIGPAGFGPERFVTPEFPLSYQIQFLNKPEAAGPAEQVVVTQHLDPNLDLDTFELSDFGFGDINVTVPAGRQFYNTRIDLRSTRGVFVDVTAQLDRATRTATWTFQALDPQTMDLPIDPSVGFLPPDKTAPEGEGYVGYTVQPLAGSPTSTRIDAQAAIVFDTNAPMDTQVWTNTIDAGPPVSSVSALPAFSPGSFTVSWAGLDDAGGSGIASYDVFVSDSGGPFTLWQAATTATSAQFTGTDGHTYAFYSVATDNVGHREPTPAAAQTTTRVDATPPTSQVAPLPATTASATFTVSWSGQDDAGGSGLASYDIYLSDNNGSFTPFLQATTHTSAAFTGQNGHTYGFYSIATDNVGNRENAKSAAEATVTVLDMAPTTTSITATSITYGQHGQVTVTVGSANLTPVGTVVLTVDSTSYNSTLTAGSASFDVGILGGGSHSLMASYAAQGNFAASSASGMLAVNRANPTVAITGGTFVYDGNTHPATATVTGVLNDTLTPVAVSYNPGGNGPPLDVGAYTATATFAGDHNYNPAGSSAGITITAAPTSLALSAPTVTYGQDGLVSVTVSNTSTAPVPTGNVTLSVDSGTPLSGTLSAGFFSFDVGILGAGGHSLAAAYATQGNFAATFAAATLTVNPASLTVTADSPSITYGSSVPALTYTYTGLVNHDNSAAFTGALATMASGTPNAGSYAITQGTLAAIGNYTIAAFNPGTLTVNKAGLTVTANSPAITYGSSLPALTYTYTGLVNHDSSASFTGALATTASGPPNAGSYTITQGTLAATGNYTIAIFSSGTLTVNQATLTVTVNSATKQFDTPNPMFTATITGLVNGDSSDVVSGAPSLTSTATTTSPVGSYPIAAAQGTLAAANYNFTFVNGTLAIALAPAGGAAVYVLSSSAAGALTISGNGYLQVSGAVDVDSSSSSAISASGNAVISAGIIQAVGNVQTSGNAHLSPAPVTGVASFGDPLANLAVPSASTYGLTYQGSVNLSGNSAQTINPGIYSQITVSGNGKLTLNPGIYILAGGGFTVTGNGTVSGSGVLLYNAGSNYLGSVNSSGSFNLSGNGNVSLTPMTTGAYAGILLFQARDNTCAVSLTGNANNMPGGVIYAPAAPLTLSGNGHFQLTFVINTLRISGNGGGGADHLFGGYGEDILIGGTIDYTQPSLNAAAFDAILQEWNRTDRGFDDRMSDLLTGSNSLGIAAKNVVGGTAILLDSTTVHDDLAADVLTGGTGRERKGGCKLPPS
jgi:RHS repeat-associated protein